MIGWESVPRPVPVDSALRLPLWSLDVVVVTLLLALHPLSELSKPGLVSSEAGIAASLSATASFGLSTGASLAPWSVIVTFSDAVPPWPSLTVTA